VRTTVPDAEALAVESSGLLLKLIFLPFTGEPQTGAD